MELTLYSCTLENNPKCTSTYSESKPVYAAIQFAEDIKARNGSVVLVCDTEANTTTYWYIELSYDARRMAQKQQG